MTDAADAVWLYRRLGDRRPDRSTHGCPQVKNFAEADRYPQETVARHRARRPARRTRTGGEASGPVREEVGHASSLQSARGLVAAASSPGSWREPRACRGASCSRHRAHASARRAFAHKRRRSRAFFSHSMTRCRLERATQAGTAFVFATLVARHVRFGDSHPGSSFVLAFRALPWYSWWSALSALLFSGVLPFARCSACQWLEKVMGPAVRWAFPRANIFVAWSRLRF